MKTFEYQDIEYYVDLNQPHNNMWILNSLQFLH